MHETFRQGLCGWEVTDCAVTLTHAGFWSPVSTAGDFRKLTPLVLMRRCIDAGTEVCEPVEELELEIPEDTFGAVCGALVNARATIRNVIPDSESHRIICEIPDGGTARHRTTVARADARRRRLGVELCAGTLPSPVRRRCECASARTRSTARTTWPR